MKDLPLHLFRIVGTRVLLDVSCRSTAASLLESRLRLMFVGNVRPAKPTPWIIITTFLDAILIHLTSVERFLRVFPTRKALQEKPAHRRSVLPVKLGKITDRIVYGYVTMWCDASKCCYRPKCNFPWKFDFQLVRDREIMRRLGKRR